MAIPAVTASGDRSTDFPVIAFLNAAAGSANAARKALESAFGRAPVITGEGGSIPVVSDFEQILGAPVLLVGFGLPGENAHAPDEWISEENFRLGMRAMAEMWDHYAAAVAAA